jgi:hypothetical protein
VSLRAVSVANSEEEKMMSVGLDELMDRHDKQNAHIAETTAAYFARRNYDVTVGPDVILVRMDSYQASRLSELFSRHGYTDCVCVVGLDSEKYHLLLNQDAIKMDYDFLIRKLRYEPDGTGNMRLALGPLTMTGSSTLQRRSCSVQTPSVVSSNVVIEPPPLPRTQSNGRPATAADFGIREDEQLVTRKSRNCGRVTSAKFRAPKAKN